MLFCLKKSISKFHVVALALLFAVTVAGCGGGSSTSTADMAGDGMTTPDPMEPTDADKVADAQDRADTAATAAKTAADKAKKVDPIDDATQAEIDKATAAAAAAAAAKTIADGTDDPGTAEAAADLAETEQGKAETAYGAAKTASATLQGVMDTTASAQTKTKAISAENNILTFGGGGGLGGDDARGTDNIDGTADDQYSLTIAHKDGAPSITIKDSAMADDDDPKFMQYMDLGDGRSMHVRVNSDDAKGKVEEVVIVSTDIDPPKATLFGKVMGQGLNANADGGENNGTDEDNPPVGFTIAAVDSEPDEATMARLANIKSGGFTAGTAAVLTFDADDTDTPNKDESAEVEGTYNDAEGTYTCTSGTVDCTVTLNAKGAITRISAGWTFFPAAGATSDVPDDDYLYYGFWLKKTTKDNVTTYNEVQTFARSKAPVFTATEMTNVMGTANYKGDATGVYVHENNPLGGGDPESATSGHFTAGVELTAYFNGDDVAENKKLSISGAVSDFQLSGGQENSWEVTLGQADFRTGENANAFGDLNADGGGGLAAWGGRFYGAVEDDPDDDADVKLAPDIVTGEFNANFPNGSAAGAFGARKQDE